MDADKEISAFEVYTKKWKNIKPKVKKSKFNLKCVENSKIKNKTKIRKLQFKNISYTNNKPLKNIHDNGCSCYQFNNNEEFNSKHKQYIQLTDNNTKMTKALCNDKVKKFDKTYLEVLHTIKKSSSDPVKDTETLFEWLIYPLKKNEFFKKNWEKTPLHIKRNKSKYYKSLMSTPVLDKVLRDNYVLFSKNLDITSFTNDVRETHNPVGRALPSVVWDYFTNGCSIRMLNPQVYISKLHTLNSTLQEFFGSFVGANSYLTPPNTQGFAPHYDDIEAFILQIEGKKRWKLYKPRNDNEFLPRYSSSNFSQKEIGQPIFETIINAGDLLYFPRGTIHQGDTIGFKSHSLHITLSVYQKNSWGDFLEKLVPVALKSAIKNDIRFRKGLPLNYLKHIGTVYSNNLNDIFHQNFLDQTKFLLSILLAKYINIDKAADEMAKDHIYDFLPPVLNADESLCSVYEGGERMIKDGLIINRVEIEPDTFVRLTRGHCARLIDENGLYRLYYSCENSKEYHEHELQFFEVDSEFVPAIQKLIFQFPNFIKVEDLPINGLDKKIQIVRDMWEKAIVVSKKPLSIIKD